MAQDAGQKQRNAQVDWEALEASPEFRELVAARKRLIGPLLAITIVGIAVYTVLLLVGGDGFLAEAVIGQFTWGLLLIVLMTVLIFVLAYIYSRVSVQKLDPLVERTRAMALAREQRFTREDADAPLRDA
jgi:uncharacterized membrane protein (DUF485 family)